MDGNIKNYTFGTLSVGKPLSNPANDHNLIETALEHDLWIHASRDFQEGRSFQVLGEVFAGLGGDIPGCIVRIRADDPEIMEQDVYEALKVLNLKFINVAQLYTEREDKSPFVLDFEQNGPVAEKFNDLQREGLIREAAMEVFSSFAESGVYAVRKRLFKNFVFYYNLVERQVDNLLFDEIEQYEEASIFALRPIGSLFPEPYVTNMRDDVTCTHTVTYDQKEVTKVLDKSDCKNLLELSVRFLLTQPKCKTIIGGTSSLSHLDDFIMYSEQYLPLQQNLVDDIKALHRRWYK
ncbi:hypothetical protein RCC89_11270 [Cytophagaceae bacterium ABcell3]|nr:hypothetical protein RCC89_11270 [Cytophagaceae bacterium ABcell3]